ncbi:site-specific DNA-methyltransferase [Rhizorhabdus wittichii]|uniref:Methyltransferase n=1 Tax=Rhizorhabdus wittichii TaxID=160791 RepID=A0A975HDI4_9SPHN|nr:site-specific DNA-methyltransferase [Rhizorhabdus wittichii]QTH19769.1 site-specific DNA-methyltransferase [Rhizorhabdus wittichii]
MTVTIHIGDVFAELAKLAADSIDCCVTSPPYWGLRDYGVDGQIGLEPTLGEHLDVMVRVFDEVRRVLKPEGTLWLNYGDCYATKPNGRSAADTKAAGNDDRTFRDKPFSTVGPIYPPEPGNPFPEGVGRRGGGNASAGAIYDPDYRKRTTGGLHAERREDAGGRIVAGGLLKPKDLCMIPNRLAIALQDAGWWVRSEIVWGKPNPMPDSSGRYRPSTAHEKIFLLTKSAKSYYDAAAVRMPRAQDEDSNGYPGSLGNGIRVRSTVGNQRRYKMPDGWDTGAGGHGSVHRAGREKGRPAAADAPDDGHRLLRNYEPDLSPIVPPEVWEIATAAFSEAHFATFPPALVAPCLAAGCPVGGTVLDPFGGAGTIGLVADRMQRHAVLIELNPEYAAIARRRLDGDRGGLLDAMEAAE